MIDGKVDRKLGRCTNKYTDVWTVKQTKKDISYENGLVGPTQTKS